ncbi:hypothetical protein [Streptomyces sp. NRRL B-24720]|uniref:hypothetical protein n=1 Tax=Streptomyces sp. NRRL B-24720 TaxID=1476876 RepID=UPI00068FC6B7|nr:hypothetical protein [Streptomyces sp. NRRL B-24720]
MPVPDARAELQINGTWTNVTNHVCASPGIRHNCGRPDEGARVDPSSCSLTLKSPGGLYSNRNPLSPYYGLLGRNTPMRVSVGGGEPHLVMAGPAYGSAGASTVDTAALDILGDIDIRFEATLSNWTAAGTVELMGKGAAVGNRSWLLMTREGRAHFEWSVDGTNTIQKDATVGLPVPANDHLALRVTLDVNNGASGNTVTFYTAPTLAGPWTVHGAPVITAGVTSIFNSSGPLLVGQSIPELGFPSASGRVQRAELRNGINGTVVANPDFTLQTPGAVAFTDAAGRAWTVGSTSSISDRRDRFTGEVAKWPPKWNRSGHDVRAPIEGAGMLRRLGQGAKALDSTLRRRVPTSANLLAYWPLEDQGSSSGSAASPIPGVKSLQLTHVNWGAESSLPSSNPLPVWNSNGGPRVMLSGAVPAPKGTPTGWQVRWVYKLDNPPVPNNTMMRVLTTGKGAEWYVQSSGTGSRLLVLDADGGTVLDQPIATDLSIFRQWVAINLRTSQSGGNVSWALTWEIVGGVAGEVSGTFPGTFGQVRTVASPPDGFAAALDGMAVGHIAVFSARDTDAYTGAITGYAGETAGARAVRLTGEESIPFRLLGPAAESSALGSQRPDALLTLLGEGEQADGGTLFEDRDRLGLLYRGRTTLYNQTPSLTVSYGQLTQPFEPVDDDSKLRNDITVQRTGGSSARVVQEDGPLSVAAPPAGVGTYDEAVELNLYDDLQPEQHAGWRVHLGTLDEARYKTVTLMLHKHPGLVPAVVDLGIGDVIRITDLPPYLPPGPVDLIVEGYSEDITPLAWTITFTCSPAVPWNVGVVEDPVLGRADTDGSQLASSATSSATTLSVATTTGFPWVTDPREYPFDLTMGGEVVTALAAAPVLNPNPLFLSDLSGWSGLSATIDYDTTVVHSAAGATASMRVTGTGATSASAPQAVNTPVGSVIPGDSYTASGWVYSPAAWSDMRIVTDWFDAANAALSTAASVAVPVPAGVWTFITLTGIAPAGASRARVRPRIGASPAVTDVSYWWNVQLRPDGPVPLAADTFDRTVSGGWGAADSGQTWVTNGGAAADYAVSGSIGRHIMNTTNTFRITTVPVTAPDVDMRMEFLVSALPVGGSAYVFPVIRYIDTTHLYFARVQIAPTGAMTLTLRKRNGAETQLGSAVATGFTYAATVPYMIRVAMTGSTLMVKLWPSASAEPAGWQITVDDTDLTAPGSVGFRTLLDTAVTNVPITAAANTVRVVETGTAQRMAVVRSVNGIAKAQAKDTPVSLAHPTIVAL